MSGLTPRAAAWAKAGEQVTFGHRRIFVHTTDGRDDLPPIVLLHGYPSSSFDWRRVIDRLPDRRTITFDFLGFGLSEKPRDVRYSLLSQADIAECVIDRYASEPVTLVAHDMGTSVASELLARAVEDGLSVRIGSVLLTNGSMVIDKARLSRGQRLLRSPLGPVAARLTSPATFGPEFRRLFSPQHPLTAAEASDQWSLLAHDDGNRLLHKLIHYVGERTTYAGRWHGALRDWPGDLRIGWGLLDPVAVPAVLDAVCALRPAAPVTRWAELGHYPQIEDPSTVAELIRGM